MRLLLFLLIIVSFGNFLSAGEFVLVRDGKPVAEIVKTPEIARHIEFFNQALQRCTGTALPVVEKRSKGRKTIVFQLEKRRLDTEDAFEISFPDQSTMLIRGSRISARWALNGLLEELGVCFVLAGPHGTYYPKLADAEIPIQNIRKDAAFKLRRHMSVEDPVWEESLNGKKDDPCMKFVPHNLGNILPPGKYASAQWRNKIMPLRNGKRFLPSDPVRNWQPCFSNPASVTEAVQNICAILDKNPGMRRFSLGVNDLGGFCECPECIRMNGGLKKCRYPGVYKSFSEIYFKWANRVVEGVLKKHPDVFFDTLAYRELIDPPSFPVHERIIPVLTIEINQNMVPNIRSRYKKLIEEWSQRASSIGFWEYGYGSRYYSAPRMYTALQSEIIRFYAKHKGSSFFAEGDSYIGEGPKRYLYYKLTFDPEADLQKLLQKWYESCVGKEAAPYLKAYYDLWENFWAGKQIKQTPWYHSAGAVYFNFSDPSWSYAVTEADLMQARSLMEKMRQAANNSGDADQKIRAERLYGFFELNEARTYSLSGTAYPPSDRFTNEAQVVAFLQQVPKMSAYRKKIPALTAAVLAYKEKETFPDFDFYARRFPGEMMKETFSRQIVRIIPFLKSEKVLAALQKIADSPEIDSVYRQPAAALLESGKMPSMLTEILQKCSTENWNYSNNTKVEKVASVNGTPRFKATSLGGWCCPALVTPMQPNRMYMLTARITPDASFSGGNARVFLSGANREYSPCQSAPSTTFPMKKEPIMVYALVQSHPKAYRGKAYFILNGIKKGESVYIDSIEMKCLEKPRIEKAKLVSPTADPKHYWRIVGNYQWKDGIIEFRGPGRMDSAKMYLADKKKDIFRIAAMVRGKGFFMYRIHAYPKDGKRTRSVRSGKIRLTDHWQLQEFESDLSTINFEDPVRIMLRIEVDKNSTIQFRDLSAVVENLPE